MVTAKAESLDTPRRPRRWGWLVCLAIAVLAIGTCAYFLPSGGRFNSDAWKAVAEDDPGKLALVDDLLARHELVGMKRNEIDDLLGTPPRTPYFQEFDYVYWLGPERGFISIDSEWLCIAFDNDVVVEAKLMRD